MKQIQNRYGNNPSPLGRGGSRREAEGGEEGAEEVEVALEGGAAVDLEVSEADPK